MEGSSQLLHKYFQKIYGEHVRIAYFGDHYLTDVYHTAVARFCDKEDHMREKWDAIAIIEELFFHDKSLDMGLDPDMINSAPKWGGNYFWEEVPMPNGTTRVKRNYFVSEVGKSARYAMPFVRNIAHLLK